jgi:hypothetical protein
MSWVVQQSGPHFDQQIGTYTIFCLKKTIHYFIFSKLFVLTF